MAMVPIKTLSKGSVFLIPRDDKRKPLVNVVRVTPKTPSVPEPEPESDDD